MNMTDLTTDNKNEILNDMPEKKKPNLDPNTIRIIKTVLLILIAVLSLTLVGGWASSAKHQAKIIDSLDEKKETVLELAAGASATSVAITLLPGDAATPIAEELAELTNYFLLILCAIYLEKYMVTITGFLAFRILIPVAMLLFLICLYKTAPVVKRTAWKITVFALALWLVIPCSVWITSMIDRTYDTSIQSTLDAAKKAGEELTGTNSTTEETTEDPITEEEEETGFLESISSIPGAIKEKAEEVVSSVTSLTSEMLEKLKVVLHSFIEAIAVMIITSCVIPILVLVAFFFLAKNVLNSIGVRSQNL